MSAIEDAYGRYPLQTMPHAIGQRERARMLGDHDGVAAAQALVDAAMAER